MKKRTRRIISKVLVAVIMATSIGYSPPPVFASRANTEILEAMKEVATPSEAESQGDKGTPSEAENPGEKATPSETVKKFVQVEPEEIPEYYSQVSAFGKRFWKFEDRYGMMQYRDYGYMQGETEFPLWYEADGQGNVAEDINEEDEYYELAPYLYKSAAPTKASWSDLSWKLLNDSESIFLFDRKESESFKNWDHSIYTTWSVNGLVELDEEIQNNDLSYFFYGQILNESDSVEQWYYADVNGNIWPMKQFKTMMLMAEAPTTCKLTFDANGGTIYSDSTYEKELTINTAVTYSDMNAIKSNVKRAGYTFDGWNYEPDGSGTNFYDSTKVASDTTIYAKWRKNQYTVMFYRNYPVGDTTTYKYKSVYYGDPIGTFMDAFPVGLGMEFKGWYLNKYCTGDPVTVDMLMPGETLNLYGKWESFDVTYKMHYGYGIDESTLPTEIKAKSTVVGRDLAKYYFPDLVNSSKLYAPGYVDGYWTDTSDMNASGAVIFPEAQPTWYPQNHITDIYLKKAVKRVVFDLYYPPYDYPKNQYSSSSWPIGGSGTKYGNVIWPKDLSDIMAYVPSGKKFVGLFTDPEQKNEIDLSKPICPPDKQDKKDLIRYTVYLGIANESSKITFKDWDGSIISEKIVNYGDPIEIPSDPVRSGYRFLGWDKEINESTKIGIDTEITAQYAENSFRITLDGNGGTLAGEESKSHNVNFDDSLDQVLVDGKAGAARKYYTFVGWYTDPTGGSKYPESGNKMLDSDLTIYAHWERSSSEVVFKDWNGSVLNKQEVAIGADATPPAAPERTGYTFTGWDKPTTNIQDHTILTVQYTVNSHKLTLVGNGGTLAGEESKNQSVNFDASLDQVLADGKASAARKYYTFVGWYTDPTGGSKYPESGNKMPDSDLTIYAHWERSSSEVVFKDWNGSVLNKQEVAIGADATPPADPERTGYTFTGWDKPTTNIQDNTTLTAQYTINSHKITFVGNGGTLAGEESKSQSVNFGDSFDQVLADQKSGASRKYYTFAGWYTEASGGSKYLESGNKMPDTDLTIYAHWERSSSEVVFRDWNGSVLDKQEVAIGADALPPTPPERDLYEFTGWDYPTTNILHDLVLTAQYKMKTFAVPVDADGGSVAGIENFVFTGLFDITPSEIDTLMRQFLVDNATKAGFKLVGFEYSDSTTGGVRKAGFPTKIPLTNDLKIYLIWAKETFQVTYKDWNESTIDNQEVTIGEDALPPKAPDRPGYTFTGWDKSSINIQANTIITAQYSINGYLLTLDGNGGTMTGYEKKEVVISFNQSFDQALKDGRDTIARPGYHFDGWYTSEAGGNIYSYNGNQMPAANVTVFAHWTPNIYNVTFDPDHERWSEGVTKKEFTFDTELGSLPAPEIYGWSFLGWWTGKDGTGTKITERSRVEPKDAVYYGNWDPVTYEVHFTSKVEQPDGESVQSFTVNQLYDQEFGSLPLPEEKGYTFNGWYDENNNKINPQSIFRPDSGAEGYAYHAEWKANPYKIRFVYTEADGKQKIVEIDRNYFMQLGTLPAPEKPGYTFAGWFNETGEKITSESWVEAGNVEYKAKWIANQYTIHFDRNLPESGIIENPEDKTVTYGFLIGELPILQETVYLFLGWYTEPAGGKRIKETTFAALGDQTYYAHWVTGWIDNGNGTYSKPGNDGKWNTEDDEIWWKGPDGIAGTDDDKLIHTLPGGGFYVDNGNGTHIRPGNGGSWKPGETEHWWNGPGGIPGGTDNKIIHTLPGGGSYVDNGNGTHIRPGNGGSWKPGETEHWWNGPGGIPGGTDNKIIHPLPGGGFYVDNGNGTHIRPGNGGSWKPGETEHWWNGPGGIPGGTDNKIIHPLPGGGSYVDNGNGTHIRPGNGGSWKPGDTEHWWNGPGGIPGGTDNKIIHTLPGGGSYVDNGDGTYIKPGPDGSLINGPEHWSSGPDGEIGTSDDKKIDSGNVDPEPTTPEPTTPEPTTPEPTTSEPANPKPIKPESEKRVEEEIINAPVIPVIDSTVKPVVPDTGGTFTVNPNNPLEVTYTKPDGTAARNEWVGDGTDLYHVDEDSKLNYNWFLESEKEKTWFMLNNKPGEQFGAALRGWYSDPKDTKKYFFDPGTAKMLIGWQRIDNKMYYFAEKNQRPTYSGDNKIGWEIDFEILAKPLGPMDRPFGSMYRNEYTPDGYWVDENGVCVNK